MPSQPPLIMVDNKFDRINLYPLAVLTSSTALAGREVQYLADYRRERSYYQAAAAAANQFVQSDLGAGNTGSFDFIWIDRGHNLWSTSLQAYAGANNVALTVPAVGTVGGDPTSSVMCVTEEGALYSLVAAPAVAQTIGLRVVTSLQPIITGLIMGLRVQLSSPAGWSSVRDEDAGERSERMDASLVPGYEGYDRTYSARSVELRLAQIGATEYDSMIRGLRRTLFEVNQPAVIVMNYGTNPDRAWLYKYRGKNWSSPMQKAPRSWTGTFFEYGPLIR
jgi:hypothetical protein